MGKEDLLANYTITEERLTIYEYIKFLYIKNRIHCIH